MSLGIFGYPVVGQITLNDVQRACNPFKHLPGVSNPPLGKKCLKGLQIFKCFWRSLTMSQASSEDSFKGTAIPLDTVFLLWFHQRIGASNLGAFLKLAGGAEEKHQHLCSKLGPHKLQQSQKNSGFLKKTRIQIPQWYWDSGISENSDFFQVLYIQTLKISIFPHAYYKSCAFKQCLMAPRCRKMSLTDSKCCNSSNYLMVLPGSCYTFLKTLPNILLHSVHWFILLELFTDLLGFFGGWVGELIFVSLYFEGELSSTEVCLPADKIVYQQFQMQITPFSTCNSDISSWTPSSRSEDPRASYYLDLGRLGHCSKMESGHITPWESEKEYTLIRCGGGQNRYLFPTLKACTA